MAQITNDRAADRPRLRLIPGGQAAAAHREEQKRRAELQQFIKACEALYEKNRAAQKVGRSVTSSTMWQTHRKQITAGSLPAMRVTAGLRMRSSFWQSGSTLPLPDECAVQMT